MIKTYRNKETERADRGTFSKRFPSDICKRAKMRLDRINATLVLNDLRTPPSHRLEALHKDRKGQHSIRINNQWRICFVWKNGNAYDVDITDYH